MGKVKLDGTVKVKKEKLDNTLNGNTGDISMDVSVKEEGVSYEDKVANCNAIAKPLASRKLAKKCYKLIKKAAQQKKYITCGIKLVQKKIRLGQKGIVLFAGDVSPIDIMCHMPGVCENKNIPYCYVPSRQDIGAAMGLARGCLMVLVADHPDYKDLYDECKAEIKTLALPL